MNKVEAGYSSGGEDSRDERGFVEDIKRWYSKEKAAKYYLAAVVASFCWDFLEGLVWRDYR
jgi:hypothetical protein